jgi:hypothetical protein
MNAISAATMRHILECLGEAMGAIAAVPTSSENVICLGTASGKLEFVRGELFRAAVTDVAVERDAA